MSTFSRDHNRAVWFDIPVVDLDRASKFYAGMLGCEVNKESFESFEFAVIEHAEGNGGCLVEKPDEVSDQGLLLYLNVHGRIRDAVEQVKSGGGKVLEDTHGIGPHGFRAVVLDSEGNRLALHSEVDE